MRRPALLGIAAATLCAALGAGLWSGRDLLVPVAGQVAGSVLEQVARAVAGTACAQEALEFKPLPPESASALEKARARRRAARVAAPEPTPAVAPAPAAPVTPAVPVPPVPDIQIDGRSGDMMRIGQDIHIEQGQTVTGDVVAMGGDITVDGHVEGDVQAMGGDVYLNSTARVDGDVMCMGGRLHEESGAQVGGQRVTALGPRDGKRWGRIALDRDEERHTNPTAALIVLIVFTALAWGFARLAPGRTGAALERVRTQPGPSFLVGLLIVLLWVPGFIAVALLAAVLCITLIGIPVAIVLLLAYPAMLALVGIWGWAVFAALVGGRLAARGGPGPAIDRAAMYGGLAFGGALVVASLLHVTGVLSGLGTFVRVMTWIGFSVGSMLGAGALVRNEFLAGTLNRWWTGRRTPSAPAVAPVAPAAPAVVAPPAPEPVVPPPPPSPPTSFMPPGGPPAPGDPPAGA